MKRLTDNSIDRTIRSIYYHDAVWEWRPEGSSEGDVRTCKQLVLPQQYRQTVLHVAYDVPMPPHMGITMTKNHLLQCYYWTGIFTDVANYCWMHEVCQKNNPKSPPGQDGVSTCDRTAMQ